MTSENQRGFYVDRYGNLQTERRASPDRRAGVVKDHVGSERRRLFRRQVDREIFERDHKIAIKEALEDFAEEHGGHL